MNQNVLVQSLNRMEDYLKRELPTALAQQILDCCPDAPAARLFCAGYAANKIALQHNSIQALLHCPDIWLLGTEESVKHQQWLQEAYPKHIEYAPEIQKSILVCGKCKKRTVDYYEKQTRGADEPMTVFAHCLSCDKRWTQ
jgi:DNA-directed RNA polymerase subunit M/transcription elongation factor TFIIS